MKYKEKIEQYLFVIRELVTREIKRKYARSSLGIIWSVLNPLLLMSVMSMIFSTIFKHKIENYPIYYLTGMILWSLFTGATNSALTALVDNKGMLMKVKLPMLVFPLARCCTALANYGYSLIAFVMMLLVFRIRPNIYMPLILLFAAGLFMFSLGISYILSVLYVFFGDIKHLYGIVLRIWMYMSALFYPVESITGVMRQIISINPVYNYIACSRQIVLQGELPSPEQWARFFIWSIGMYIAGRLFFDKMKNKVIQKI